MEHEAYINVWNCANEKAKIYKLKEINNTTKMGRELKTIPLQLIEQVGKNQEYLWLILSINVS